MIPVYVPAPDPVGVLATVIRGSGIVGVAVGNSKPRDVLIDFEGNRYGAENIVTFADRCWHAHDRQSVSYPTIARAIVQSDQLVHVGWLDRAERRVEVKAGREQALADWLGLDVDGRASLLAVLEPELRCSR